MQASGIEAPAKVHSMLSVARNVTFSGSSNNLKAGWDHHVDPKSQQSYVGDREREREGRGGKGREGREGEEGNGCCALFVSVPL